MKIVVTYEYALEDIKQLIHQDLVRRGIPANGMAIKYTKGIAVASVEVTEDAVESPTSGTGTLTVPIAPAREAIDDGVAPVDMNNVFQQSTQIASTKKPMFPLPQHTILDGESTEWPGDK